MKKITSKYPVLLEEYERGWGSRLDEVKNFDKKEEALKFIEEYNEKYNKETQVPDWYIVAKKGW